LSTYLLFFLLGLGGGSVYAILGLGLVLQVPQRGVWSTSPRGAVAMYGAYVFIGPAHVGRARAAVDHHPAPRSRCPPAACPPVWALLITLAYGAVLGRRALPAGLPPRCCGRRR